MDHKWPQWIDATNYEHKNRSRPILLAYCDSEKDQIFFLDICLMRKIFLQVGGLWVGWQRLVDVCTWNRNLTSSRQFINYITYYSITNFTFSSLQDFTGTSQEMSGPQWCKAWGRELKCSIYCKSAKNNHSGFTAPRNFHSGIDLQIASWPWVFLRHLVSLALRRKWSLVRGVEGCWRLTRSYKILTRSFLHWRIQVCGLQHYSRVVYPYHPMAVVDILWWYQICNRAIWAIKIESYLLWSSFNLMVNPKHWPGHDVRLPGDDAILFCLWWNLDRQDTQGRAGPLDITAGPRTLEIHTCLSIIVCRELQTNILYYIQNMSTLLNSLSALSCR